MEIFPLFPRFEEVNFSTLPVAYMLIFQSYKDWKTYLKAIAITAGIFTWIAEPVLIWLKLYAPLKWVPSYGFPVYVAIGLFAKWAVEKIYAVAKSAPDN